MRCIFWSMIKRAANMRNRNCMLCPTSSGTAVQSMVNHELGEPDICAATSEGDFYYCSEAERNRRFNLAQSICQEDGMLPKWEGLNMEELAPEEPDFEPNLDVSKYNFNFTPEQMGIDAFVLYAKRF